MTTDIKSSQIQKNILLANVHYTQLTDSIIVLYH